MDVQVDLGPTLGETGQKLDEKPRLIARAIGFVQRHPVLTVFVFALVLRTVSSLVISTWFPGRFALDDTTYSGLAAAKADGNLVGWTPYQHELWRSTFTFVWPLSLIFEVVGPQSWAAGLFVALLGALAAAGMVKLASEFLRAPLPLLAGVIIAVLPSQILWSSLLLKDTAVWACITFLAIAIAIAGRSTGRSLVVMGLLAAGLLLALGHLREHSLVVACAAIVPASLAGLRSTKIPRLIAATVLALGIPWAVGIGPGGWDLITDSGSLAERRLLNAAGAQSSFIKDNDEQVALEREYVEERKELTEETESIESKLNQNRATLMRLKAEKQALAKELEEESGSSGNESEESGDGGASQPSGGGGPPPSGGEPPPSGGGAPSPGDHRPRDEASTRQRIARVRAHIASILQDIEAMQEKLSKVQERESEVVPPSTSEAVRPEPEAEEGLLDPSLVHLPLGLRVMLVEPVPWRESSSANMNLAKLESLLWYPLLALALVGLWRARGYLRTLAFPILYGAGILVIYALTEGNIGTAYRHRGEFVWVAVLLAGLGLQSLLGWRDASIHATNSDQNVSV